MLSLASINTTTEDPISESCDPRNILQLVAKALLARIFTKLRIHWRALSLCYILPPVDNAVHVLGNEYVSVTLA